LSPSKRKQLPSEQQTPNSPTLLELLGVTTTDELLLGVTTTDELLLGVTTTDELLLEGLTLDELLLEGLTLDELLLEGLTLDELLLEIVDFLGLLYRPCLHTSGAGSQAPGLRMHAVFQGAHPAFTHFHPPHLDPAQEAFSLADKLTRSPLSFSQYINPLCFSYIPKLSCKLHGSIF
jgi:hypothetical protein